MINSQLIQKNSDVSNTFTTLNFIDFYNKFTQYDRHNNFALNNNKFNSICPNLKLLLNNKKFRQEYVNGYRKLYYDNKLINKIVAYDAFYPENFYHIWEILNEFKLVSSNMKNFLLFDDGDSNKLGHIEALIKYCEDNFKYEDNEYIRIQLNKSEQSTNFCSVYNHKVYNFDKNKYIDYFKNKKFDFVISTSSKLSNNVIPMAIMNNGSNCLLYVNNFLDSQNNQIINNISTLYNKSYVYQPEIQDKLEPECWLILIGFIENKNNLEIINCIINNKKTITVNTNLKKLYNEYVSDYIGQLINLYGKTEYITEKVELDTKVTQNAIEWAIKYKLVLKNSITNLVCCDFLTKYDSFTFNRYSLNNNNKLKINGNYIIENNDLHMIKRRLNEYKRIIDTKEQFVKNNYDKNIIDWYNLINNIDMYKNLRKIILWKHNAELVNNIWIKFYEIISHEDLIDKNITKFKSFHLYETTGSSIAALNHYISTQTNIKSFEWYAQCQSYNEFKGKYDLWNLFPQNWMIDGNGNGNLKNINTLNYYLNCESMYDINLIICDGEIKIHSSKFTELEGFASLTTFVQIYTMLHLLSKDGSTIIKLFLPLVESMTISILYLLSCVFECVKLVKPVTSYSNSSEIYCVCKKYYGFDSISDNIKNRLEKIYYKYDVMDSIFPMDFIDTNFIDQLCQTSNLFVNRQINSIKRSVCLRDIYYEDYDIQNELSIEKEKYVDDWININKITPICDNNKIVEF